MIIEIINKSELFFAFLSKFGNKHGLSKITDYEFRNIYRVIDKHLFFLSVIKYGLEFKEINYSM